MFPFNLPRIFPTVYCDAEGAPPASRTAAALKSVKSAVAVPENELKRWRRTFDTNAQTEVEGTKYVLILYPRARRRPTANCGAVVINSFPQVLEQRAVRKRDRSEGRPQQDRAEPVRNAFPRRGHQQARARVLGRLCRIRDHPQAARRGLLDSVPILRRVRTPFPIYSARCHVMRTTPLPSPLMGVFCAAETSRAPFRTMSSRTSSTRTLARTPSPSTSSGTHPLTKRTARQVLNYECSVTGSSCTSARRTARTSLGVRCPNNFVLFAANALYRQRIHPVDEGAPGRATPTGF